MPRLFAETCKLAHDLGIKYVWIDSLCIKQGDDDEWRREAPQMAQYYQNAWITVVAAKKDVDNGLLDMRRTEPVPRMTRLPYMDRNGEQKGYFYLQRARPDLLQKEFWVGIKKSELLQRGWVFQEWRLSRRIIAFSDSSYFLHCHNSGAMSPMGDLLNEAKAELAPGSEPDGSIMQSLSLSLSRDWEDIVSEYSGLELTFLAKDRLMALAGIASEVGRIIEARKDTSIISGHTLSNTVLAHRYVCGLWLINIHDGLLWEQATQGSRERLPGIPTWSWASMASHITDKNNKRVLTGMSVRWPKKNFSRRQRIRVCAIRKTTTIPINDQNWLPQFSHRPFPDNVPEFEYGNGNRFVVLTIHGSLQPVQIENLLSEHDADLAMELTSPNPYHYDHDMSLGPNPKIIAPDHSWGIGLWRGICFPTDPGRIIGWASVEHPELQSPEEIASCSGSIFALFLERFEENGGWFRWGQRLVSRVVFSVLLLRRVSILGWNECFERVGVGRLFGDKSDKRYLLTKKTIISLI